ncbi:nitrite reductase small subunit NirD [Mycobacterium fragae]|jgi:nitrite reductase (NADH) small subunit|nr:nitrite reductase small subunit NirD [Mycobacterium fragae]MCV7402553.1 nitrite reductase small subunit NirD [Mycobacterium fragae]
MLDRSWTVACAYDYLIPGRGVGVLLDDGSQAALFRLEDGSLRALGNVDPFSGAAVLSRGLVGDRGGRAVVQSPIGKQAFSLDDGRCLDDPAMTVPVYPTRLVEGIVQVGR